MAAPTLDLRTYLLLERAFVRRLQRSWRLQSAPLYAAIAEHCRAHQWDKARLLVPDLDMTEVGTENREWITYILLSFAVFGAGTVSRKQPSFVGVGSFDTFLKQITSNFLQYLELNATAQIQAEAMQSIAEDEAKTKALKWDPNQRRGADGRWVTEGKPEVAGEVSYTDTLAYEGSYGARARRIGLIIDGKEVGHAEYRPEFRAPHVVHLEYLGIEDRALRGQGHGERFYRHVVEKLKKEGFKVVLGDVTSAAVLRLGTKIMGTPALDDGIDKVSYEDALKRLSSLAPEDEQGRISTANYLSAVWILDQKKRAGFFMTAQPDVQSVAPGLGGITRKFDESKHPRDKDGRFAEASQPRIFNRLTDVGVSNSGWAGDPDRWAWIDKETGKPGGHLLTGKPIPREQLPETLYHVTTNAPAVEASGVLLGQRGDTGLGGGQAEGVSFTSSPEDAHVIRRELIRAVQVARGEVDITALERWAREDEQEAGIPEGTLQGAAAFAREQWDANQHTITHTFVWDENLPEDKRGWIGPPPPPAEQERLRRSSMKDALSAYLQIRGHHDTEYPTLKNPILFGRQEHLAKIAPEHIQTLEIPSNQIPAEALVTTGSDTFLHEVRVYSDVPLRHKSQKFQEAQHPRHPEGTSEGGRFAESGHAGVPTSDPVLAQQAKAGIAAIEKLIPEATRTADWASVLHDESALPTSWTETHPETQQRVQAIYLDPEGGSHRVSQRQERWHTMSDAEKWRLTTFYHNEGTLTPKKATTADAASLPTQWVTGVSHGTMAEENYARTGVIARQLTVLRTDQLRDERGLRAANTKPTYTIEPAEYPHPSFLIKDASGQVIGASNTETQATANAEAWATELSTRAVKMPTDTLIAGVWQQWKRSSSEGLSLSMQLAAARELGGHHRMTPEEVTQAEGEAVTYGGVATLQAYVRAQWEVTQFVMAKAGEESLGVYRGLMLAGDRVRATPQQHVDKNGDPIAPPSDIEGGINKQSGKPYVRFKFAGEQFVVEKDKRPPKSILEVEPHTWFDVGAEEKAKVYTLWQEDATKAGLTEVAKVHMLFNHLGDDSRFQLMSDYIERGRMTGRPVLARPYETDAEAITRRLDKYLRQDRDAGVVYTKLPEIALRRAGAQSVTGTREIANTWGGVGNNPENPERVVLRIEAPATSVLSLPVYGENAQEEHESVLLGTPDKWLWDAWRDRAPLLSMQSIARKADQPPLVLDLQAEDRGKPHWLSLVLKWEESQHPRDNQGQFTDKPGAAATQPHAGAGGSGGVAVPTPAAKGRPDAVPEAQRLADSYNATRGLPPVQHAYTALDEARAGSIADAYDALPLHDEDNPEVQTAYEALATEIQAQWDHITGSGVAMIPWTTEGQPYKTSTEMAADVRDHQRLYFFTGGNPNRFMSAVDAQGLSINDKFRAVHDYFGHAAGGYGFGARGEENAWMSHSQMLSPEARRALTTETRGQNSWVNFGRHNYEADGTYKKIPPADRPFATQKAALFPDSYALLPWEMVLKWDESQHPRNADGEFTRVAMTSQRTEGDPGHQTNKDVFRHMRVFHAGLRALPGVSRVSVKPGVGGWKGGSESMWQIYYRGNGAAAKLVAQTAKRFNQDAVLILKKCQSGTPCQPAVELSFDKGISGPVRDRVHATLVANGIGGWTWMKRNGKTILRMVSVPQWGGDAKTHQIATARVSQHLREDGLPNHRRVRKVSVHVMQREGAQSYDTIIGA